MRPVLTTVVILSFSIASFGQKMTFENWQKQATQDKRLLPKYGGIEKSLGEIKSDKEFEKEILKKFETVEEAANHMIDLGFQYLYRGDHKTAMYRFNQAYLLDDDNSNIYWGYGAIYMSFGRFDLSREQYEEGLKVNEKNDNILIDYGTTYMGEYYEYIEQDQEKANRSLALAIEKLFKAHYYNPDNANSSYKLSICYLYSGDCTKAIKYLEKSEALGNANITDAFKAELYDKCKTKNIDCADVKTGKFKSIGKTEGVTIIERTANYQIEENSKHGYKLKLKVTWIDGCTYQLVPVEDLLDSANKDFPKMILTCAITKITEKGYVLMSWFDRNPTRTITEITRKDWIHNQLNVD